MTGSHIGGFIAGINRNADSAIDKKNDAIRW
jgi:hypothetical protein